MVDRGKDDSAFAWHSSGAWKSRGACMRLREERSYNGGL